MLKPTIIASSAALVLGTAYALCGLVAMFLPDLYFSVVENWLHSFNLELVKSTSTMTFTGLIFGVISFGVYIWVVVFATAWVYGQFAKKK